MLQRPRQAIAIHLDPLATDQDQPLRLGQQVADLRLRQLLAVERHLHLEVEQCVEPQLGRRLAADRRLHLRACRAVHAPARRHAHDHAGALERRHVLEELCRLRRTPAQGVVNLPRIDHALQPRARLGCPLHGRQQRQEALAVARAGIVLEGLAERQVLRLALDRKPRRIGRHECERRGLVLPVLGQIEVHAADQVPGRIAGLEEVLWGKPGLRLLGFERGIDAMPQVGQHGGRHVLRARHRWDARGRVP